jgi:Nucleotidyl transferase AbiEii toxin, Type IV TA system
MLAPPHQNIVPHPFRIANSLVCRHVLLNLHHHDRASLLAGKLYAVLQRPFLKGRDLCDLIWYLSDKDWPDPNLVLLNNALNQTAWTGPRVNADNWREIAPSRIEALSFEQMLEDVIPFLELREDIRLLNKNNLMILLK